MNREMDARYEPRSIKARGNHVVTLDNRERSVFSGVQDVISFNEDEIILVTDAGELVLSGVGLHISKLDLESGQLAAEGRVLAVEYLDGHEDNKKRGVFSRLFR